MKLWVLGEFFYYWLLFIPFALYVITGYEINKYLSIKIKAIVCAIALIELFQEIKISFLSFTLLAFYNPYIINCDIDTVYRYRRW